MIEKINEKIRHIRELKNYSQEYIANELNISIRAYSKIENGETQLTIKRLNEICHVLRVSPQEIFGFNPEIMFKNKISQNEILIKNNTNHIDINLLKELYEKLLAEKDNVIKLLQEQR